MIAQPRQDFAIGNVRNVSSITLDRLSPTASLNISCVPEATGALSDRCTCRQRQREQELVVPLCREKPSLREDQHIPSQAF